MRKDFLTVPKRFLKWRVTLGFVFAGWYLWLARPASLRLFAVTTVLVAIGCALRSWAAGYLFKGKRVAVGGPYAYVRNPLYLGSFIIGVGCLIALWRTPLPVASMVIGGTFLVGYGIVYPAKIRAEEGELRECLNGPYETYAHQVPAFLPWRGCVRGLGEQRFSRELYRRNLEHQCILGSLGILALLLMKYLYA